MQTSAKKSVSLPLTRFRFKIQYCQKFYRLHTLQYIKFSLHSLSNFFFDEGRRVSSFQLEYAVQMPASKDSTTLGSETLHRLQGATKRCCLSWLTNSALVLESQSGGMGGGGRVSAYKYSCSHHVTLSPYKLWRSASIPMIDPLHRLFIHIFFLLGDP
jgi:hypothetical protein